MLVNPQFSADNHVSAVLSIIGGGALPEPVMLRPGFFLVNPFNLNHMIVGGIVESWRQTIDEMKARWQEDTDAGLPGEYGVCDTPEQFMDRYQEALDASSRRYVVSFCIVLKSEQPSRGGWRWYKWGEYIGTKTPEYEYLADEGDDITQATCFHVYELPSPQGG